MNKLCYMNKLFGGICSSLVSVITYTITVTSTNHYYL